MPRGRALILGLAGAAVLLTGTAATANWQDSSSATMQLSSGSLVAATAPGATGSCLLLVPRATVTWTPTTSVAAVGYRIYRRVGSGSFALHATVSGRTTSSYVDSPLSTSTTYSYYVMAHVGGWTASTATVSVTTPALCL